MTLLSLSTAYGNAETLTTKEQEIAYCNVQQRFWFDYDENQKGADKSMLRKVAYYRERLLALADPSSSLSRYVTVRKYIDEKNFAQADFINRHSLSRMDPASHDYANLAYFQARICESLNRREEMKNWFIRSAMADIKTATRSLSEKASVTGTSSAPEWPRQSSRLPTTSSARTTGPSPRNTGRSLRPSLTRILTSYRTTTNLE